MDKYAIIVAGGKGQRMQSDLPKQFMMLLDAPVLMHTIERFAMADQNIQLILVLPENEIKTWQMLCAQLDFDIQHQIVSGGKTRFESVQNGLKVCPDEGCVAIHDGVRPLISVDLINHCFSETEKHGSAIPVVEATQSLRRVSENGSEVIDRSGIVNVQTPQCFLLEKLKPCYKQDARQRFTDDASVYEAMGNTVHLVKGETANIKLTNPEDIAIAEAILAMSRR